MKTFFDLSDHKKDHDNTEDQKHDTYQKYDPDLTGISGLDRFKRLGITTVSLALRDDTIPIDDPKLKEEKRLAILLGNEGCGLEEDLTHGSDHTVMIPMSHGVDSLNVAACSAVAFWELGNR